jgi:predicted dehydrogenase
MTEQPLRVAIIGMGGFAGAHHAALNTLEAEGGCRVVCTCDPRMEAFRSEAERWEFARRGVRTFTDYQQMLEACHSELDVVTVPTPVPLHAPMHRACVERGLACYLEKPPTLDYAEMEAMLEVEAHAAKATQVGFNFIVEPTRQALKQRLLAGEFGAVRRICFRGVAPRDTNYFHRAVWAGRLILDDKLVLDSCIGNAMAHYIHNLHFWAGQEDLFSWAEMVTVEAELYRAHAIQGMDTVFLRGHFASGIEACVAATHAADGPHEQWEWVECERATLTYDAHDGFRIQWKEVAPKTLPYERADLLTNLRAYFDYLRDQSPRPVTRLADARPFVRGYDLAYVAAGQIIPIAEEHLRHAASGNGDGEYVVIEGIRDVVTTFFDSGRFPSQQDVAWAQSGGRATPDDLPRLRAIVEQMAVDSTSQAH